MTAVLRWLQKLGRATLLLLFVAAGTMLLMRLAPGYFADAREMDARYAQTAHLQLQADHAHDASLGQIGRRTLTGWLHGDLGRSRQYDIPVADLVRPRLMVSLLLLAKGLVYGWLLALSTTPVVSLGRRWTVLLGAPSTLLLAVPTAAFATLCLLARLGGPVLVLTLLLAARDFKFLTRALRCALRAPHLLQARAQGLRPHRVWRTHLLPSLVPQLIALAGLSIVTALSAIVPVEVLFDVPGIGRLAWNAAMNRDLPVLTAVTLLMAAVVAVTSMVADDLQPVTPA